MLNAIRELPTLFFVNLKISKKFKNLNFEIEHVNVLLKSYLTRGY